ncbi:MAG: ribosome-associated translation inhibitor RaiA [Candidatus Dormibacteraceae bacterium]
MKVVLHDRTDGIGQEVRDNAERKLSRLARHFEKVVDAEVDFSEEGKHPNGLGTIVCRINLHLDGRRTPVLSAHERGADAMSALDLALDKIDRQVVKFKEKVTNRKKPVSPVRMPAADSDQEARSPEPERVRIKLRPMSISDAVEELEADSQPFFVFLDEDSGAIEIVARRADGSIAVIEPVVT